MKITIIEKNFFPTVSPIFRYKDCVPIMSKFLLRGYHPAQFLSFKEDSLYFFISPAKAWRYVCPMTSIIIRPIEALIFKDPSDGGRY